jgi:hypothetical protein
LTNYGVIRLFANEWRVFAVALLDLSWLSHLLGDVCLVWYQLGIRLNQFVKITTGNPLKNWKLGKALDFVWIGKAQLREQVSTIV